MLIVVAAVPFLLGGVLWLTAVIERWLHEEEHTDAQDRL